MIHNLLSLWLILNVVGISLLFFRTDYKDIFDEIMALFRPFPLWIFTIAVLIIMIPTTIPYSLREIMKRNDKRDN
jgi:NADH:ubiquinone oxidoreductase subunit K